MACYSTAGWHLQLTKQIHFCFCLEMFRDGLVSCDTSDMIQVATCSILQADEKQKQKCAY